MGTTSKYNGKLNVFGKILREYRLQNDLSMAQVSVKFQLLGIDLSSQSIHLIENGRRVIKDYELGGFAKIFGISTDKLFKEFYKELE